MNETARTSGVVDERVADGAAGAQDHVEHALGHAGALEDATRRRRAVSGVSVAGLKTTVLPATSAGAIFQTGMATGKFQGVMQATTPSGWRRV